MKEPCRYLNRCLNPVHVGSGGYRIGRVDMAIVREPATGIPKIPGTSLAGAIRAYAEMDTEEDSTLPEIRIVFGEAAGNEGRQGMLRFYDADIVLFPLISDQGKIWVSTEDRLRAWLYPEAAMASPKQDDQVIVLKGLPKDRPLNLSWLLLEVDTSPDTPLPARP